MDLTPIDTGTSDNPFDVAMSIYRMTKGLAEQVVNDSEQAEQADVVIRSQVRTGIYEHFKSTRRKPRRYVILCLLQKGDSPYAAMSVPYDQGVSGKPFPWPLFGDKGFLMPVARDWYQGPRLTFVRTLRASEKLPFLAAVSI